MNASIKCLAISFCIDKDNFIKSVRELGTEHILASFGLTSRLAFFQVDLFSVRNLFLWKTKRISSFLGKRISFAEEMDFFCERARSLAVSRLAPPSKSQPH